MNVYSAGFQAPLTTAMVNQVQSGKVIPVKITVGCGATMLTGVQPSIRLLDGDQDGTTDGGTTAVPTSSSAADTTGYLRDIGGGQYLYNMQVPTSPSGTQYTIRVRPFGEANTAASLYVLIKIH